MAGLLDLFSGRSSDIYGGALTPEQRGGLGNIGLLALAGKLGQLAGPSFSPVPDFGAALGQAAGAYGASQEGAGTAALNAILTGQRGRKLEQELDYYKQLGPVLSKLAGDWPGAGGGTAATPETGSTGGGAAAPLGAGGGGGADPSEAAIIGRESGGKPYVGYGGVDLSNKPLNEFGFPIWEGRMGPAGISHAAGLYQFQPGTWATYAGPLGIKDFSPESQRKVYLAARAAEGARPWAASAGGGGGRAAAAPTAAAPAGGGGLLNLPQVPNFSSRLGGAPLADVGDTSTPADVLPNRVGRFAGVAPGTPVNSRGFPYNPEITDPAVAARVAQSMAAIKQAQQSGVPWAAPRESSGSSAAAPADIYAGTDTPQGPMGDPGPTGPTAMVSGLLTRGGPLTRGGVSGLPATPPAAAPSADPSQLGPLAAPAPAAAAPGALPAAPALPRVNPAFDAYARNLAVAAGLAKGAGLPDALGPLLEVFKGSPGYRAQQTIAEKTAAQPFEQAQTLFNKQVEIAGVGPIEAAKLPYALAQAYFKAEQDIRTAGPVAAAQNFERIRADNAAKGIITTKDADGNIKLAIDPDAVKAVTEATVRTPDQVKADIARETTRIQQEQQARYEPIPGGVPVMGADGKTTMMPMSRFEYDLRKRLEGERRGAGAPSSAPQPGDIVGTPYKTPEEQAQTTEEAKGIATQNVAARQTALASREGLILLDQSRDQLQGAGIFTGLGAGTKATVAQFLAQAGFPNDKLASTQVFLQQAGARTAEILRSGTYGTGTAIGATDLRAADKLAIGDNTVELETIKRLFDLAENKMRRSIDTNNDIATMRKNPEQMVVHPDRFRGFVGPKEKPEKVYERSDGSRYVLPFVVPGSP